MYFLLAYSCEKEENRDGKNSSQSLRSSIIEIENDKEIAFLDIMFKIKGETEAELYRKETDTDR